MVGAAGKMTLGQVAETVFLFLMPFFFKRFGVKQMLLIGMFAVGLVVSFVSAWLCIRWLLRFISTHSFVGFAYYRIVFGLVVLVTAWTGTVHWAA